MLNSEQIISLKAIFQGHANKNKYLTTEEVKILTNHVFLKTREAREIVRTSTHFRDGEQISDESRFVAFVEHIHNILEMNKANLRYAVSIAIYCLLEQIQTKYENEGNYIEAAKVQSNLKELIDQEIIDRLSVFHSKQMKDLESLKNAHNAQENTFTIEWDKFEKEFESKATEALASMRTKQGTELQRYKEKLTVKAKSKPPLWSKELKQLRKREMILASEENYSEAAKVKEIADALELEEQNKIQNQSDNSCSRKENNMQNQHEAALHALTKRISSQRESNKIQREDDCKRLVQRNRNIQVSYKSKQITESQKFFNSIQNNVQHELAECRENGLPFVRK